jgi:hypothetical protein
MCEKGEAYLPSKLLPNFGPVITKACVRLYNKHVKHVSLLMICYLNQLGFTKGLLRG